MRESLKSSRELDPPIGIILFLISSEAACRESAKFTFMLSSANLLIILAIPDVDKVNLLYDISRPSSLVIK